jgi:hypothetical protein
MDLTGSIKNLVVGFYVHGNETLLSSECTGQLYYYKFLKKDSAP